LTSPVSNTVLRELKPGLLSYFFDWLPPIPLNIYCTAITALYLRKFLLPGNQLTRLLTAIKKPRSFQSTENKEGEKVLPGAHTFCNQFPPSHSSVFWR
jgi:hypothetical protein